MTVAAVPKAHTLRAQLLTALGFALLAAFVRAALPDVKTRLQIMALLALAGLFELFVRPALRQRRTLSGYLLNALAIVLAMIAVKIAIDGRPNYPPWMLDMAAAVGLAL